MKKLRSWLTPAFLVVCVTLGLLTMHHGGVQAKEPHSIAWPVPEVAAKVSPSVVGILNFRGSPDGPTLPQGSGSGVIIRPDGYIVTNDHVVRGATLLKVMLPNGKTVPGKLVGEDSLTDLAVLKVKASGLTPAHFAKMSSIKVGELAIAIGNPMGPSFDRTVTTGVISGLNRSLGLGYAQRAFELIQTDAAINPGNSGGPLVDEHGNVLGINSVKVTAPGFEGMGFAIPADIVHSVADEIIKSGRVMRPWLGIGVVGPSTASRLGIPLPDGLLVEEVYPGGPGADGGLQPGDIILKVHGEAVHRLTDLYKILGREKIGTLMTVVVRRGRGIFPLRIKLTDMPSSVQEGRPQDRVHQGRASLVAPITTSPAS